MNKNKQTIKGFLNYGDIVIKEVSELYPETRGNQNNYELNINQNLVIK